MRAINRKLLRDLIHLRGQVIAVLMVVACGIATFVAMLSVYGSLHATRSAYYDRYRFAHLFATVRRAPQSVLPDIAQLPGVAAVHDRIVMDVTLEVPGLDEPASARLVSIPEHRRPILNDIHLREGSYISPGRDDQVIASEAFAQANGLRPGDTLAAVINGRWKRLRIAGIGLSPEFVYEVQDAASILPDNRRFGVLWMGRAALASAFDLTGAFNDVTVRLSHGANKDWVLQRMDRILEGYGSLGAYDRDDQISHAMLNEELRQLQANSVFIPAIFLAVAGFLLHIVLKRLVGTQRDQIAVLKAFGYSNAAIGLHYMLFALVSIVGGGAIGTAAGMYLGAVMTDVYTIYYHFPILRYVAGPGVIASAVLISAGAAIAGALGAVRKAVELPPAEAMRPEAPARFRPGFLERLGFQQYLSTNFRMVLRSLERNRWKAVVSVVGIAFSVAILVVGQFSFDAMTYMISLQYRTVQREDVMVVFNAQRPPRAKYDLMNLPGVQRVETMRIVPVRLRNGHRSRRQAIQGYESNATLRRIVDADMVVHTPSAEGLMMTRKLGEILDVGVGDSVTVEVLEGHRPVRRVRVAALLDELLGMSSYMETGALARLAGESPAMTGAFLLVDDGRRDSLYDQLKRTPAVAGTALRERAIENFEKTIADNQGYSATFLIVFAGIIAVGIVYNSARIALSERGRELASLRVLGFSRAEVARLLLTEQALLTLLAIPVGWLLGLGMCAALVPALDSELFRIPMVVNPASYVWAGIIVVASGILSGLLVRHRIFGLDLVEVLKTRE